jgi:hypothetical protein
MDIMAAKHCSGPTGDLKIEFRSQFAVTFQVRTQVQRSRDSLVVTVTGLRAGRRSFCSQQGQETFLYAAAYRRALGSTQPPPSGYRGLFSQR